MTYVTVDVRVKDVNNSPSFDRSVYKVRHVLYMYVHVYFDT